MDKMKNLTKLSKVLPPVKLCDFISSQVKVAMPLDPQQAKDKQRNALVTALKDLDAAQQLKLEKIAEQLIFLTDGPGQDVVEGLRDGIFVAAEQKEFDHMPNSYERSLWLCQRAPRLFKEALDARQADIFRQTRSCYAGFIAPKRLVIVNNGAVRRTFHERMAQQLGCEMQNLSMQIFMRRRLDLESGEEADLYQISLHRNGSPEVANAEQASEPSLETDNQSLFLTYEPASGKLEMLSKPEQSEHCAALVRITADTLFRKPFSGQSISLKQYDYQSLAAPRTFDLTGEESVAFVKVTELGYTQENRTLQVKTWINDADDIYAAAKSMIGAKFDFTQHQLTHAKLSIRLHKKDRERARILAVVLHSDNVCDIKAKCEKDRKLCERLMVKWQLIKEINEVVLVDAPAPAFELRLSE